MKYEQLKPNLILPQLEERLEELKEVLKKLNDTNSKKSLNEYSLRIAQKQGHPDYYYVNKNTSSAGKYIPKNKKAFAQQLAQKNYDTDIINLLQKEIKATESFIKQTGTKQSKNRWTSKIQALYSKMCPARQNLVTPITLPEEQYKAKWVDETWEGLPFQQDAPVYTTMDGVRVRSKSEVLIADALARQDVPYRYEYPLILQRHHTNDTVTIHPDFLCLNLRTRQEFYWEHFGLMDSPEYVQNAIGKLHLYSENKIIPGHNLIITMETQNEPLTPYIIEQIITKFLI
jgi:predicted SprT family Zn-dependent metalloprotease